MKYGEGDETIVVATTRAETMLGDTAVAVHPDDERYKHLVGKRIKLPLTDRTIPVVADTHVDPEFGTGAVKVTPAHDPNDFAIGQRHDLESSRSWTSTASSPSTAPSRAWTASRPAPRSSPRCAPRAGSSPRSVRTSTPSGTARAARRPSSRGCPCSGGSRSARSRRPPVTRSATAGSRSTPQEMEKRYFDWVDNLHDWCISRQLWWGHRIPVWYGPDGEVVCVGPDERAAGHRRGLDPGHRRPRHLVLLRPVAVLHPRLARTDPGPQEVLPDRRPAHRPRHHLLLGRPDDDVRPVRDGRRGPLQDHRPDRSGPRRVRQEDVEVLRQRGRPARLDGRVRLRRRPLHPGPRRQPRYGRADRRGLGPGVPELRQQDLERHALRADERRDGRGRCPTPPRCRRRTAGSSPG
jgi:hypothetical protein